jgi:Icc-related predicted phosphoesterase
VRDALTGVAAAADLLLLAGDLTSLGQPQEAAALARICAELAIPTYAVLGNHDWHADRHDELLAELAAGGIVVLEGTSATAKVDGCGVGIVGTKGFIGGFSGHSHLDDFGEPALRHLYREASRDVQALDDGLTAVALCPLRIVLLHYSPTRETLAGEPEGIWAFLGNDRLAAPILQHEPDLVLHGHAHAGAFAGAIGDVPVRNVSMQVLGSGYEVFELHPHERASATMH